MRLSDETVVRVIPSIHRAHAIQFPHLNRGEQVIHGKRIVRMTRHNPLEILNRRVVVEVVIVLESRLVQRIGGTERGRNADGVQGPLPDTPGQEPAA